MFRLFWLFAAPIISLVIVTLGSGFLTTLLTVRLHAAGSGSFIIGLLTAFYYLGLVIGSFSTHRIIKRVGHIRIYSAFAAIMAVSIMLQGIFVDATSWIILRFISGFCIAGLYIAIESWMLVVAPPERRGQVLSLYMVSFYAALGGGQFLLNISNPSTIMPFAIIVMLTALSIVPVCMTRTSCPNVEEATALSFLKLYRISPSGVLACFAAGLITSVIYGLMPLFVKLLHFSDAYVSWVMGLTIFGAMAIQYPIGRMSDFVERRKVLIWISVATLILTILLASTAYFSQLIFLGLSFIFGGVSFTLYPIGISHTCDYLDGKQIIAATQGLLLANGIGSILGPVMVPSFINMFGPEGLFVFFGLIAAILSIFFSWRRTQTSPTPVAEQQEFVAMPKTTPLVTNLDPRAED